MRNNHKSRHPFVKTVLIFLALLIVSATAYYAHKIIKNTDATLYQANLESQNTVPSFNKGPSIKLTNNWTTYSNQEGSFSLKYPNNWVQPINRRLCASGTFDRTLYLGSSALSVLRCGINGPGQVSVASYIGDQRSNYLINNSLFSNIKSKSVGVSGVVGTKVSGTLKSAMSSLGQNKLASGSFVERYTFFTNGNTYVAQYQQNTTTSSLSQTDLSNFDLMITKTLAFHS